jgi:hypothetical protein
MFLVVLGFEFRASCLLNRHSTTWSTSQVPRNGSVVTKLWAPLPCRHTTWGNGTGIKYNKLHTLIFIGSIKALPGEVLYFYLQVWEFGHPNTVVSSPTRANLTLPWTLVVLQRDCHENVDFWLGVCSSKVRFGEPKKTVIARVKK